ncbi:MAG: hypothetical protein U0528_00225 [Anaerolineae bacterium]
MNLQEAPLASLSVLALWLTLRSAESRRWQRAVWAGIGMFLCVATKSTGLIFLAIPGWYCYFHRVAHPLLYLPRPPNHYRLRRICAAHGCARRLFD